MPKKDASENVNVSLNSDLVSIMDDIAKFEDVNRSHIINKALKLFFTVRKVKHDPDCWRKLYELGE
jgi:metal-responsive CopG/Arc/MetJ family transcriptional regulator